MFEIYSNPIIYSRNLQLHTDAQKDKESNWLYQTKVKCLGILLTLASQHKCCPNLELKSESQT